MILNITMNKKDPPKVNNLCMGKHRRVSNLPCSWVILRSWKMLNISVTRGEFGDQRWNRCGVWGGGGLHLATRILWQGQLTRAFISICMTPLGIYLQQNIMLPFKKFEAVFSPWISVIFPRSVINAAMQIYFLLM